MFLKFNEITFVSFTEGTKKENNKSVLQSVCHLNVLRLFIFVGGGTFC